MRIAVVAPFASSLSWWRRLHDEGSNVRVWIPSQSHKTVGDGLVNKAGTWPELLSWAKEGTLAGEPTIMLFDASGEGEKADEARKWGLGVVGGGTFCDRLERDRSFGRRIAHEAGAQSPPCDEFKSISEAAAHAAGVRAPLFFKTDRYLETDGTFPAHNGKEMATELGGLMRRYGDRGRCTLEQKIEGVALSTARWWNGARFVGPYEGTYENKRLMNDDVGPSTGCSFNVVWFYAPEEPHAAVELGFANLERIFRKEAAPPGIYDLNAMVDLQGTVWFLEWTPRLGYDAETTSMRLLPDLSAHLYAIATADEPPEPSDALAYSVRIGVPPYPWEHGEKNEKGSPDGLALRGADGLWDGHFIAYNVRDSADGELELAGPEGLAGLTLALGHDIEAMHDEAIDFATNRLKLRGKMYRTDGGRDCARAGRELLESGVEVHPGLLVLESV